MHGCITSKNHQNYIRTRQLTAYRIGNAYRIKREDFNQFLEKRKVSDEGENRTSVYCCWQARSSYMLECHTCIQFDLVTFWDLHFSVVFAKLEE